MTACYSHVYAALRYLTRNLLQAIYTAPNGYYMHINRHLTCLLSVFPSVTFRLSFNLALQTHPHLTCHTFLYYPFYSTYTLL